jgi:hypothetical protein
VTRWNRALVPAQLRLSLGRHPQTPPIARANLETAAAIAVWADIKREEAAAPKRQESPRIETERFRNEREAA